MSHSRRMGVRNLGGPKRLPRQMRYEDLPKDNFTPRTYQVELLDSARERNTIICLGSSSGRMFIAVMLMKEMAESIRESTLVDGKPPLAHGIFPLAVKKIPATSCRNSQDQNVQQSSEPVGNFSEQGSRKDIETCGNVSSQEGCLQDAVHDCSPQSPNGAGRHSPVTVNGDIPGTADGDSPVEAEGESLATACDESPEDEGKTTRRQVKKSFYLTDTDIKVEQQTTSIQHPADVRVRSFTEAMGIQDWLSSMWLKEADSCEVLVMTGSTFLHLLNESIITFDHINLLVIDECHLALKDHPYKHIMNIYKTTNQDHRPRVLGLTSSILAGKFYNPDTLESMIMSLEEALQSTAETSTLVISERYGIKPTERVIECADYEDTTGLVEEFAVLLENAIDFLDECNIEVTEELDNRDPRQIPRAALIECHNILHQLGPWCAACLADMLIGQIEKIEKQKEFIAMHKKFLKISSSTLRMISKIFDNHFKHCEYSIEDLLSYSTPKVANLMTSLRKYRPEMDFVIISEEVDDSGTTAGSDSEISDDSDFSDNDDDNEPSVPNSKSVHVAIKRVPPDDNKPFDPFMPQDDKYLCGIVFVDHQHEAYALSKFIEEVCAWDDGLCFVRSSHITAMKSTSRKEKKLYKKQEDILRKFRMQELNLLISTNVLEEGVDLPRCNLIVRFDTPKSYRSYSLSKGQARARDAEYLLLVEGENADEFEAEMKTYSQIEQVLVGRCKQKDSNPSDSSNDIEDNNHCHHSLPPYIPVPENSSVLVTMKTAIVLVNRYCAKLPSDAFTHLTPACGIQQVYQTDGGRMYIASLRLPINSPIKTEIEGVAMPTVLKAKQAVALKMCELLHTKGELDDNLMPVGKEMFQGVEGEEEDSMEEEEDMYGEARPGTTKRKQYYWKKVAGALLQCHLKPDTESCLYMINMKLTGAITEDQNTRGRRICAPEDTARGFGILTSKPIPMVPMFPVFTRSGEVTVSCDLLTTGIKLSALQMTALQAFHKFLFSNVLRLEKDPMDYVPTEAGMEYLIVPLNAEGSSSGLEIDWEFTEKVKKSVSEPARSKEQNESFAFINEDYEDAVVMPSYRNIDQPQYFYVAEIRTDLNPQSQFPSPELYKTFAEYYTSKYGLSITNMEQPLLDVDHTSARLNLLIPRYMNQKGVALPTSSAETKKARRENLQQKQILVPELCDIHVFLASLWRKAVCLPAILYRMNYLLLAEEIRKHVAMETKIGIVELPEDFRFPKLDFGFDTSPENLKPKDNNKGDDHGEESTAEKGHDREETTVEKKSDNESQIVEESVKINESDDKCKDIPHKNVGKETNIPASFTQENNSIDNPGDDVCDTQANSGDTNSAFHDDQIAENKILNGHKQAVIPEQECLKTAENLVNHPEHKDLEVNITEDSISTNKTAKQGTNNAKMNEQVQENSTWCWEKSTMKEQKASECNGDESKETKTSHWDDDLICEPGNNRWSERNVCSLCAALSQELGLNDLTVTHCPQCTKLRQPIPPEHNSKETGTTQEKADDYKPINGEIFEPILEFSVDNVSETLESMKVNTNDTSSKEASNWKKNSEKVNTNDIRIKEASNWKKNSEKVNTNDFMIKEASNWKNNSEKVNANDTSIKDASNWEKNSEKVNTNNTSIKEASNWEKNSEKVNTNDTSIKEASNLKNSNETEIGTVGNQTPAAVQVTELSKGSEVIEASNTVSSEVNEHKYESPVGITGSFDPEITEDRNDISEKCSEMEDSSASESATSKQNVSATSDVSCSSEDTDIFANMEKFDDGTLEVDKADVEVRKERKALISLDADMDLSTFIGPSPCVILQALTMSNANDFFSLERLETIGDSFLKYAITVYLYCSYPGIHEGKLSYLRSKQVSNYNLYRLGKRKGLAECMISTKFEPYENWLPPGYIINENKRKGSVPSVPVCSLPSNNGLKTIFSTHSGNLQNTEGSFRPCDEERTDNVWGMDEFSKELQEADQILQDEELEKDERNVSEKNMFPYSLQVHHCLPDKSIADCVEALIGCYLTSCDKMAALRFMSWMGLKVLPRKDKSNEDEDEESVDEFEPLPCPGSPFLSGSRDADAVLEHLLDGYDGFEAKIGYRFRDRSYLLQAFTHTSYHYNTVTDCYQRLEFLGDAVLDYVITRHLYEDSDKYSPGVLTDLRSALVNNNIFAALAVKWDFHKYLKAVSPALFYVMEKFVTRQKEMEDEIDIEEEEADEDHEKEHMELEAPKALGDIFESVAGAIYMDSGKSLDVVWGVYYRIMQTQIDKYLKNIPKSPVRELLEQEPETAKFDKPERTMDGKIRVTVNVVGKGVFTGVGRNYRIAKSAAAKKALRCIKTLEMQGLI